MICEFEQDVVRAADHDQMLDIVAADENELPLTVEAEGVDQPEPRLARPSSRDAQPMGEHKPVDDRQRHQDGDPASRQKSDLNDAVVAERKVIQPLHAESHARAADRASQNSPLPRAAGPRRAVAPERVLHTPWTPRALSARGFGADAHLGSG